MSTNARTILSRHASARSRREAREAMRRQMVEACEDLGRINPDLEPERMRELTARRRELQESYVTLLM